ncbi:MAG: hypothetical protein KKF48_02745 [Nanoarchaeota archaeon]|nr:hypothetical protein [Nanoarchaeota archaeon]
MAKIPIGTIARGGFTFGKFFRLIFFALFFSYLLISIVLTGIQERDFNLVVKELGEEFLSPVQSAQEFALEMQGSDTGLLGSLWDYWGFYFELAKIYLWIFILKRIADFFFQGTTPPIARIGMAFVVFFFIQTIYVVYYLGESPDYLFIAFKDIFNGLIHIFTNFDYKSGSEKLISVNNTCSEDVCII